MGDASGVGPEIIMKGLGHAEVLRLLPSVGDRRCGSATRSGAHC